MMLWKFAAVIGMLMVVVECQKVKLDQLITELESCYHKDPSKNLECYKTFASGVIPALANGIPEYSIPAIEPLAMQPLLFDDEGTLRKGNLTLYDLTLYGMSEAEVQGVTLPEESTVVYQVHFDTLKINGSYYSDSTIAILDVKGQGKISVALKDVAVNFTFVLKRDGPTGMALTKANAEFEAKKLSVLLENLFGDNVELQRAVDHVLDQHGLELLDELKPLIKNELSRLLLDVFRNVFARLPASVYFKD